MHRTATALQIVGAVGLSGAVASRWLWLGVACFFAFCILFGAILEADPTPEPTDDPRAEVG